MKKDTKLIELGILPDLEGSGVSAISLVETPAIETNFLFFKKEEFLEPTSGERQDKFIPRCIAYVINEGKDVDQAAAICYSIWDESHAAECPIATQDIAVNLKNRQKAIDTAHYGPLNPELPSTDYWTAKAKQFNTTPEEAKKSLCGNCVFFVVTKSIEDCIAEGIGPEGVDPVDIVDAGQLGYCEAFDFKCASKRTCDAWVVGGPITDENFDLDTSALPPYVDETPKSKKDLVETAVPDWEFSEEFLIALEKLGSQIGFSEDEVTVVEKFADAADIIGSEYTPARQQTEADGEEFVWKYASSRVSTSGSRTFCRTMMSLGRYYSREEITVLNNLNTEFGPGGGSYSIFEYKGGANCQHFWRKYSLKRVGSRLELKPIEPDYSNEELMAATAPRTLQGRGFVKSPQRNLPPLAGKSEFSAVLKFADEEQKIVVGPAMIPNIEILRKREDGEFYSVIFSEETIAEIAKKFMKEARTNETNQDHNDNNPAGTYVYESWLIEDPKTDKANTVYGYDLPKGTWMCKMQVEDPETWRRVKAGELKGFSVEGLFSDMEEIEAIKKYAKIKKILNG